MSSDFGKTAKDSISNVESADAHARSFDAPPVTDVREQRSAATDIPAEPATQEALKEKLDRVLDEKEYVHWENPEAKARNREMICDYDAKKRAVDKATLMTQRDTLVKYSDYFDQAAIERIRAEIGSGKVEIYNEPYFVEKWAPAEKEYRITGLREMQDGKICIRDCENADTMIHTSSHESMHDLSFQAKKTESEHTYGADKTPLAVSREKLQSGIHQIETVRCTAADGAEAVSSKEWNRYLNEGATEMYTIEAMLDRGEPPRFDSYTQEVCWALQLREKVGADTMAGAYFGGDVSRLEYAVNSMSGAESAWSDLNDRINAWHKSVTPLCPEGDRTIKAEVDAILDNMSGNNARSRKRVLKK